MIYHKEPSLSKTISSKISSNQTRLQIARWVTSLASTSSKPTTISQCLNSAATNQLVQLMTLSTVIIAPSNLHPSLPTFTLKFNKYSNLGSILTTVWVCRTNPKTKCRLIWTLTSLIMCSLFIKKIIIIVKLLLIYNSKSNKWNSSRMKIANLVTN